MADTGAAQGATTRIETYIPLYRKYRPQTFADLVGQEAISQTLGNAIRLNKVAHAYLFCGPRGTGKTSAARIFAKSLNCEHGPTVTPCLQCATCVGIAAGNALDVVEFDAASNNGVNDARELIENCQYTSMSGRFKVYIIDEVHMLTTQAFNALLKTLEEPPPGVIFIFATTEAHKVLPTIISRCQRFDFNRITTQDIKARLRQIAEKEDIAIDDDALALIARHSRGGLRDAVGLLDQVAVLGRSQTGKVVGRKDVSMFIGTLEEELLLRLSAAIAERRAADLLNELGELLNRGVEPMQLLKDLTLHFRNLLLVQAAGESADPDLLLLPPDYFGQLRVQTALFPEVEELPQIIGRLAETERNIRQSSQPQLWLEVGLMALAYRHEIHRVKELSERLARLEAQMAGATPPAAPARMQTSISSQQPLRKPPSAMPPRPAESPASSPAMPPGLSQTESLSTPSAIPASPPPSSQAPLEKATPAMPAPVPAMALVAAALQPAIGGSALEATFQRICQAIKSPTVKSILQQQALPLGMDGDRMTIGMRSEALLTTIQKPDKLIHLQKAANDVLGFPVTMTLVLAKKSDAPPQPNTPEHRAQQASAESEPSSMAEPAVSTLSPDMNTSPADLPTPKVQPGPKILSQEAQSAMPSDILGGGGGIKHMEVASSPLAEPPASGATTESPLFDEAPPLFEDAPPLMDDTPPDEALSHEIPLNDDSPAPMTLELASFGATTPAEDDDDREPSGEAHDLSSSEAAAPVTQMAMAGLSADDPQLAEAKQHSLKIFQGRPLE